MNWKQFSEKYKHIREEFNDQEYDERVRTSRLMKYEAIQELIRAKTIIQTSIDDIDKRIMILAYALDKELKK